MVAAAVLIECPEIGTLAKKQAAALAGLAPMTRQSGKWKGKAFIQGGRKFLRDALYTPALVAIRFNPDLKHKYQSMIKTDTCQNRGNQRQVITIRKLTKMTGGTLHYTVDRHLKAPSGDPQPQIIVLQTVIPIRCQ